MIYINKIISRYKSSPVQVKAAFWFLICSFLQKAISMITTPVFTRLLSTAEYGQFSVFNSWLGIVSVFITLNLFYGVYEQGLIKYNDDRYVFASSLQGLVTLLVLVWTVIYLLFHIFWNQILSLTTVQMLAMLVMIWTSSAFNFWSGMQRVEYNYRTLVFITICISVMKPVLGIVLVTHYEDKVTARILGLMLVEIIGYTGLFVSQMLRGKKFYSPDFWKYALHFNIPLIPHYLAQTFLSNADRVMIKYMVGDSEAGIYSLAYTLALVLTLFNSSIMQTIAPWFYTKIKEKKEKDVAPVAYMTLIMVATVNLLLIIFAPEAVAIFAPEEYYAAIWVIPPVALSVYFIYIYDLFAKFAFYYEKTNFIMIASVLAAVANMILNFIFIRLFGYIAAGYTTLICYMIYSLGHYIFMNKVCKDYCDKRYPYSTKKLLAITILFLIAGFLIMSTYNYIMIRYSIVLVVFVICVIKRKYIISTVKKLLELKK